MLTHRMTIPIAFIILAAILVLAAAALVYFKPCAQPWISIVVACIYAACLCILLTIANGFDMPVRMQVFGSVIFFFCVIYNIINPPTP